MLHRPGGSGRPSSGGAVPAVTAATDRDDAMAFVWRHRLVGYVGPMVAFRHPCRRLAVAAGPSGGPAPSSTPSSRSRSRGFPDQLGDRGEASVACSGHIDRSERESYPRIECVLSFCQCPSVADENREAMRTTSLMDDCNASALIPLRKSSIAVLLPRLENGQPFIGCGEGLFSCC